MQGLRHEGIGMYRCAGAFYTFSRNHNTLGAVPQELYQWPEVAAAARNSLSLRYSLLPYLFTLFALAHRDGGTVLQPLFWSTPQDMTARQAQGQWLWGTDVMVSPVLVERARAREVYLPEGDWLCWAGCGRVVASLGEESPLGDRRVREIQSSSHQIDGAAAVVKGPHWVRVEGVALDRLPLWLRGGSIIPVCKRGSNQVLAAARCFNGEGRDCGHVEAAIRKDSTAPPVHRNTTACAGLLCTTDMETGGQDNDLATAEELLASHPIQLVVLLKPSTVGAFCHTAWSVQVSCGLILCAQPMLFPKNSQPVIGMCYMHHCQTGNVQAHNCRQVHYCSDVVG